MKEEKEQLESLSNLILLIEKIHELNADEKNMAFGGNKGKEFHYSRKDLEKDIFSSLSDRFFRRSYRMHRKSFYSLHGILEPYLKQHFFPKHRGGVGAQNQTPT